MIGLKFEGQNRDKMWVFNICLFLILGYPSCCKDSEFMSRVILHFRNFKKKVGKMQKVFKSFVNEIIICRYNFSNKSVFPNFVKSTNSYLE